MGNICNFHILFVSSVSACFELDNTLPYYTDKPFDVRINGNIILKRVRTNVFSLFDLLPNTEYELAIENQTMHFTTRSETCCISVADFGAVGNGKTDNTLAIQNAINCCPPGGRIRIPSGTYLTGPLVLKSHIVLELCGNACLLADPEEAHYPILPGEVSNYNSNKKLQVSSWEGDPFPCRQSFISGYFVEDVIIVGRGTIDGNASNSTWWQNVKGRSIGRPKLFFLNQCQNITFHGILGKNSACWHFHPFFSRSIHFFDIAVEAPDDSPNTDGTDPESCEDVCYIGARFSVGDDAIAIKSGKMYMGMKYKTPASQHVIRNCLMERAHGAVVLGSEMSGGIKDLTVSQCLFSNTDRGLRIKTRRGRGKYAVIDGIVFSGIRMENVKAPIVMNMYYFCDPDGHDEIVWSKELHPVDDTTPYLGRFEFKNMKCLDCEWAAGFFYGLPEQPIECVIIQDVDFTFKEDALPGLPAMMDPIQEYCKMGLYFNCVKKIVLDNVSMVGHKTEKVIALNTKEIHTKKAGESYKQEDGDRI